MQRLPMRRGWGELAWLRAALTPPSGRAAASAGVVGGGRSATALSGGSYYERLLSTNLAPRGQGQQLPRSLAPQWSAPSLSPSPQLATAATSARWLSATAARGQAAAAAAADPERSFKVKIHTGDFRGSSTPCGAEVCLVGEHGESGFLLLGESHMDGGFDQGSVREFHVEVARAIGRVREVRVKKLPSACSTPCQGWYLETVEVWEAATGKRHAFAAEAWLGKVADYQSMSDPMLADKTGPTERSFTERRCDRDAATLAASEYEAEAAAWTRAHSAPILSVAASAAAVPHPSKVKNDGARSMLRKEFGFGGEDAYFTAANEATGVWAAGVADGVYMWRTLGIDAGEFSRQLMTDAAAAVAAGATDAADVLGRAAAAVAAAGTQGSATALVLTMDTHTRRITAANLGDSGFMLVRGIDKAEPEVVYVTPQQEHEFGRPFQLGHHDAADSVADAVLWSGGLEDGDVVVAGTDGLFDNLELHQVVEAVRALTAQWQGRGPAVVAKKVATHLTEMAFNTSMNRSLVTPYSRGASEAFDMVYSGGKKDDICVLCAIIGPVAK